GKSGEQQSNFTLSITCQFCWQLDPSEYRCSNSTNCMTVSCPRKRYNATCDVLDHVHCLGMTTDVLKRSYLPLVAMG
ncbi:TM2 domain-containing protein 3, partial [Xenoophorus captivus]